MDSSSSETSQSLKSSRNEGYWSPDLDSIDNAGEMCELEVKTEEDKEIAAKAVALVVNKTRKGVVPLCTSVACLLQDKYRLERQVQQLQKELSLLQMQSKSLKSVSLEEEQNLLNSSFPKQPCSTDEDTKDKDRLHSLPHKSSFVTVAIVHQDPDEKKANDNSYKISSANEAKKKHEASSHCELTCEKEVQCNLWDEANKRLQKHLKLNSQIINKLVQGLSAKQHDKNPLKQSLYPVKDTDCNKSLNKNLNPSNCFYINRYSFERNPIEEDLCSVELGCKDLILPTGKEDIASSESHKIPRNNYSRYLSPFQKNNWIDMNLLADGYSVMVQDLSGSFSSKASHCHPFTAPFPLLGCKCRICDMLIQISKKKKNTAEAYQICFRNKPILNYGDVVLITGEKVGSVHYLGHLDGYEDAVFVGVSLDKKETSEDNHSDWIHFECSHGNGVFVPLHHIICIVERLCW